MPKRGFTNIFRKEFQIVNVKDLQRLGKVTSVTPESLFGAGLISKKLIPVKILGDGDMAAAVEISAHAFSASAKAKIEKAGGKAITL